MLLMFVGFLALLHFKLAAALAVKIHAVAIVMRHKVVVNVVPRLICFSIALFEYKVLIIIVVLVVVVVHAVVIVMVILEFAVLGIVPILLLLGVVTVLGLDIVVTTFFHRFPTLVI